MQPTPQHTSARLPEPEVTDSDFGTFCDEAEAFCDAEEARAAAHPAIAGPLGCQAEDLLSGLRTAHTSRGATDWHGYALTLETLIRRRLA